MTSLDEGRESAGERVTRSWWPWVLLVAVLVLALAVGSIGTTGPATNEDRVVAIAKTIKCPQCNGETVGESNAEISRTIRVDIAERVEHGQSDEEIRDFYAARYGDAILLTPTSSGVAGLVWITPVVALIVSLAALGLAFRRWGERSPVAATDADRDLVRRALDERDSEAGGAEP